MIPKFTGLHVVFLTEKGCNSHCIFTLYLAPVYPKGSFAKNSVGKSAPSGGLLATRVSGLLLNSDGHTHGRAVVVLESSLSFPFSLRQSRATLGSQALSLAPQSSLVLSLAFAASFLFPWRTTRTEMSRWFRVVLSGTHKTLRRKGTMGNVVGVAAFYCSFEAPQTFFLLFGDADNFFSLI